MTRRLFTMILSASLMLTAPVTVAMAASSIEIIDQDIQNITVSLSETTLRVTNANGEMLSIYNVTGVRVMLVKVEGADKSYNLNLPKGCYIVKVGKTVRKISIK